MSRVPCTLRAAKRTFEYLRQTTSTLSRSYAFSSRNVPRHPRARSLLATMPLTPQIWADIEPTTYTFFHHPDIPLSVRTLKKITCLEKPEENTLYLPWRRPIKIKVVVKKRSPTVEEFTRILPMLYDHPGPVGAPTIHAFVNPMPGLHPTNISMLFDLASRNPELLRWPIFVNWELNLCSIGGMGYKNLLKPAVVRREEAMLRDIWRRKNLTRHWGQENPSFRLFNDY
ncbi:hypothetical protein R3P38DRAFT_2932547 [Favolaschia claudopus]|uniref:Uncharacterized protein n=1 Tax=Favolaschia claudopus TaxID=2862362 RepID=A0AAW0BUH7_9AGAR